MWEANIGVFPVDFQRQGGEWTHHLAVELTGHGHIPAHGTDGFSPVELGPPINGPISSTLRIAPHPEGVDCTVLGAGEAVMPDQVDPWRTAAQAAVAALGHRYENFQWQAIVGTSPRQGAPDIIGALHQPTTLGGVRLTPGGVCMLERIPVDLIYPGGLVRHSFPVIATGTVRTYRWEEVHSIAEWHLGRACTLLSLATGGLWIPRTQPRQHVEGTETLRVPATTGLLPPRVHPGWRTGVGKYPTARPSSHCPTGSAGHGRGWMPILTSLARRRHTTKGCACTRTTRRWPT